MAQQSIVLLKNQINLLPLRKNLKKIAVVGSNANDKMVMLSNYYGYPSHISILLVGIKQKVGNKVIFVRGMSLVDNKVFKSTYNAKLFSLNGVQCFNANYFQNTKFEGEVLFKKLDKNVDFNWGDGHSVDNKLIIRDMSVRWNTTFTPEKSGEVVFSLMGEDWAY